LREKVAAEGGRMRGRTADDRPARRTVVAADLIFNPSSGAPRHLLPQGEKETSL